MDPSRAKINGLRVDLPSCKYGSIRNAFFISSIKKVMVFYMKLKLFILLAFFDWYLLMELIKSYGCSFYAEKIPFLN